MSEKQKQLVEDILTATDKLPPEKQYQLLGVAQGMSLVPAENSEEEKEAKQQWNCPDIVKTFRCSTRSIRSQR